MRNFFVLTACLAIAACGMPPEQPRLPEGPALPAAQDDTCNARAYAGLVGQDATALERVMILDQVRIIRPGTMVTMDFRPERINFQIDDRNQIERIYCS